jgi:hypothetical protein
MQLEEKLVDRRKDPGYLQISGFIDKRLARQFKTFCTSEGITIAEALEEAIVKYLHDKEVELPNKSEERRSP